MLKSKLVFLGLIVLILAGGLLLASCDDGPCCTKSTFNRLAELEDEYDKVDWTNDAAVEALHKKSEEAYKALPKCCMEVMDDESDDLGCCEDAIKAWN